MFGSSFEFQKTNPVFQQIFFLKKLKFLRFSFQVQLLQVTKLLFLIWKTKLNIRSKLVEGMLFVEATSMVLVLVIKIFGSTTKENIIHTEEDLTKNPGSSQQRLVYSKVYHSQVEILKHISSKYFIDSNLKWSSAKSKTSQNTIFDSSIIY